jgi:hypothetical protein
MSSIKIDKSSLISALSKELTVEPSYIIFTDGTTVYARNGRTGQIEFSGTDASTVIQQAINAMNNYETIVVKGDMVINSEITLNKPIRYIHLGQAILNVPSGKGYLNLNGANDIVVFVHKIDGQDVNAGRKGIILTKTEASYIEVGGLTRCDTGIWLPGVDVCFGNYIYVHRCVDNNWGLRSETSANYRYEGYRVEGFFVNNRLGSIHCEGYWFGSIFIVQIDQSGYPNAEEFGHGASDDPILVLLYGNCRLDHCSFGNRDIVIAQLSPIDKTFYIQQFYKKLTIGYESFKSTGVSVPIGLNDNYGNPAVVTSPKGYFINPRVKITWGGTFGTGETVTVAVIFYYNDGTYAGIEKSATAPGSMWLTDDDYLALVTQGEDITQLRFHAKTNLASTSVTVTIDCYGA